MWLQCTELYWTRFYLEPVQVKSLTERAFHSFGFCCSRITTSALLLMLTCSSVNFSIMHIRVDGKGGDGMKLCYFTTNYKSKIKPKFHSSKVLSTTLVTVRRLLLTMEPININTDDTECRTNTEFMLQQTLLLLMKWLTFKGHICAHKCHTHSYQTCAQPDILKLWELHPITNSSMQKQFS